MHITRRRWTPPALIALLAAMALTRPAPAQEASHGQTLYVPVYSEIPFSEGKGAILLTALLSVRNLDRKHAITLTHVDYYSSEGRRVRGYLDSPRPVAPLSSAEFTVKESDRSGGVSASFIVEWTSDVPVIPPLAETIMTMGRMGAGMSFVGRARVLEEAAK